MKCIILDLERCAFNLQLITNDPSYIKHTPHYNYCNVVAQKDIVLLIITHRQDMK